MKTLLLALATVMVASACSTVFICTTETAVASVQPPQGYDVLLA